MKPSLILATVSLLAFGLPAVSFAAEPPPFEEILKKAEARFTPAIAKPGQTVSLTVNIELLKGWHTYPTVQPDKGARSYTNKLTFPEGGPIIFVGALADPPGAKEKAELALSIEQILYYPGGGVWERKAVVSPAAKAGKETVTVKIRIQVCDKDFCYPPKTVEVQASLEVAGDPVPVDPKYKNEVEKK